MGKVVSIEGWSGHAAQYEVVRERVRALVSLVDAMEDALAVLREGVGKG